MLDNNLRLFCPRRGCPAYKDVNNKITKGGTYTTLSDNTNRQLLNCTRGNHQFSETGYSDLFRKHGSFKEYEQTAKLLSYGLHVESISDVLNKDVRTIYVWQSAIGGKAKAFHIFICTLFKLTITGLQMDELWSYLGNKTKRLWLFAGIEPNTKFWIYFELGSRTKNTALRLVVGIRSLIGFNKGITIKITTDKLSAYRHALTTGMGDLKYVYLQIVKIRFKRILITVKKCFVKGSSDDFPSGTQNTSFIERLNLTLRQHISYLQRKTLGYCKNKSNFNTVTWINLFSYNYCTYHKGLRTRLVDIHINFRSECRHFTPAMKKNLTKAPLNWHYLITAPIPE